MHTESATPSLPRKHIVNGIVINARLCYYIIICFNRKPMLICI